MSNENDLVNITRFDIDKAGKVGQHGWWVRLQKDGKKFHNFFNDSKFGGKEEGLKAAKIFRDAVKLHLGSKKSKQKETRSNSGIMGVYLYEGHYKSKGYTYYRRIWQASWSDEDGKSEGASFSIDKYGEEEAFRLALEARKRGVEHQRKKQNLPFTTPDNINQKVWRYLDFTKFVSLLEEKSLYFSNIDSLNDPFEGSFSKVNEALRPLIHKTEGFTPDMMSDKVKKFRKSVFVNCWHMNDFESAAMWDIYSKSSESVCIQSDFQTYQAEIEGRADVGVIQYINYDKDYIPDHDPYHAFLYKRKSFEHENEVRGLIKDSSISNKGLNIPVDLSKLIHKVYVSPTAPNWFFNLVNNVVKKYDYNFEVFQSSLSDEPFF